MLAVKERLYSQFPWPPSTQYPFHSPSTSTPSHCLPRFPGAPRLASACEFQFIRLRTRTVWTKPPSLPCCLFHQPGKDIRRNFWHLGILRNMSYGGSKEPADPWIYYNCQPPRHGLTPLDSRRSGTVGYIFRFPNDLDFLCFSELAAAGIEKECHPEWRTQRVCLSPCLGTVWSPWAKVSSDELPDPWYQVPGSPRELIPKLGGGSSCLEWRVGMGVASNLAGGNRTLYPGFFDPTPRSTLPPFRKASQIHPLCQPSPTSQAQPEGLKLPGWTICLLTSRWYWVWAPSPSSAPRAGAVCLLPPLVVVWIHLTESFQEGTE